MCGIAGVASPIKNICNIHGTMQRALDALAHRGPDDVGFYEAVDHGVYLGHRRLAIVELSELGHQPMLSADGSIVLIFNGEIYNHKNIRAELLSYGHKFRGSSDTEVIVEAYRRWGFRGCIERLNGSFALAIYDQSMRKVFLARDRAGEKPLFYILRHGALYFASEIIALMELSNCDKHLDLKGLVSYISNGYPLGSRTLLKHVQSLLPGQYAVFDLITSAFNCESYWSSSGIGHEKVTSLAQQNEVELEYLLKNAVRQQLDCDVPACILLSGGIDSSLLVALAADQASKIKTFTVCFPQFPEFDESKEARLIAHHFGTEHIEINGSNFDLEILLSLGSNLDTPINDSSMIPTYMIGKEVSKFCRVALTGDGADELFGGYKHYSRMLRLGSDISALHLPKGESFFRGVKKLLPVEYRFRNWLECFDMDLAQEIPNIREIFTAEEAYQLIDKPEGDINFCRSEWGALASGRDSILRNCMNADFQSYLPSSILVKSDRASMLNSIESRAPFLDRKVMEFAMRRLPDDKLATSHNRKIILQSLCKKLLPRDFNSKRKLGFNLPFGHIIRSGRGREMVFDTLLDGNQGVFNKTYLRRLLDGHMAGKNHGDQIFGILLLCLWIRKNNIVLA